MGNEQHYSPQIMRRIILMAIPGLPSGAAHLFEVNPGWDFIPYIIFAFIGEITIIALQIRLWKK
jgi:hypothetical protein